MKAGQAIGDTCPFCGKVVPTTYSCCTKQFWDHRSCGRCDKPHKANARWGITDLCGCDDPIYKVSTKDE